MSPVRLVLRATLIVLIAGAALLLAVVYVSRYASGAMALTREVPGAAPARPLPAAYRPLHKGHIDTATGLYVREDEDLLLRDAPSFILRRTYRTRDARSRAFGVGASHTGEWYLIGDASTFQWAELILEDGGRIHYDRVSSGTSILDAQFEHWGTPTVFYGSRLAWNGNEWIIRERDGTLLTFLACGPRHPLCSIASIRLPDGKTTRFRRDAAGTLTRIETGDEWIAFEYGVEGRISRARDQAGHAVAYTYDTRGRLRQALDADGTTRSYDYDDRDRLIRIEEPGRIVENRYDAEDMCVWQRVRFPADPAHGVPAEDEPYVFRFAYTMEDGRVHQTDTWESDAPPHRRVFTVHGYIASETWDFDTDSAKTITYDRNPATGLVSGLTLKCAGGRWHTSRTLSATPATEDRVKDELLATPCVSR
jgi:YD repeat-containing protein